MTVNDYLTIAKTAIELAYMTSGVNFGFNPDTKNKLLDDISVVRFKKRRKPDSADLLILGFKKNRSYGIRTLWDEIT